MYLALLFLGLAGPVTSLVAADADLGVVELVGAGLTVLLMPLAVFFWRDLARNRRDERRVRAVGVPAAATIAAVTWASVGDETGVELTLSVDGPGLTPFAAQLTCLAEDDLREGTVLQVLVDPSDYAFTVVGR